MTATQIPPIWDEREVYHGTGRRRETDYICLSISVANNKRTRLTDVGSKLIGILIWQGFFVIISGCIVLPGLVWIFKDFKGAEVKVQISKDQWTYLI